MTDWSAVRDLFPVTRNVVYLNSGWTGPSPEPVINEEIEALRWVNDGGMSFSRQDEVVDHLSRARAGIARILGADVEEIAFTHGTTEGINIVLNGMRWQRGDVVLTTDIEHSGGLIPTYNLADRYGVELDIARLTSSTSHVDTLTEHLTKKPKLLVLSHVSYATGERLPVREIADVAHENGTKVLLDAAQSAGVFPVDVRGMDCDFYALPFHKWLVGPDETGALFVRKELVDELYSGSIGYESVDSYDLDGRFTLRKGAKHFEVDFFNVGMIRGARRTLELALELGIDEIENRIRELTDYLKAHLERSGVEVLTPRNWEDSAGLVSFVLHGVDPRVASRELERRGFVLRSIKEPYCVRASVHYFNTEEELDSFVEALKHVQREFR